MQTFLKKDLRVRQAFKQKVNKRKFKGIKK